MTYPEQTSAPIAPRRRNGYTRRMIYDYINEYSALRGFPPTVREIAEAVGVASPSTVVNHLRVLESEHLLTRINRRARSIHTYDMD